MKHSTFILIIVVLTAIFGGMMVFAPDYASKSFGLISTPPEGSLVFLWLGVVILSSAILNFLLRNSTDSNTLQALFIFNLAIHGLTLIIDLTAVAEGILQLNKLIPSLFMHSLICIGSVIYLTKIKTSSNK